MVDFESGTIDADKKIISLHIDNLKGKTYDLISEAFVEVLEQAGIDRSKVTWEEWTLTCKYFDDEENKNA